MSTGFPAGYNMNPEITRASKLPLIVSFLLLLAGIVTIPLAYLLEARALFLVGYLLTPILMFGCLIWDSLAQRNGSRDPWFAPNPKASLAIRILAISSLAPAVIQIWNIASWLGEIAVQEGWFS